MYTSQYRTLRQSWCNSKIHFNSN